MGLFTKLDHETHLQKLHQAISIAFNHARNDINNLMSWMHFFNKKHDSHQFKLDEHNNHLINHSHHLESLHSRLAELENQFSYIPKSAEEIKKIIDNHYSFSSFHEKIDGLKSRISVLESSSVHDKAHERKVNIREHIVQKITKNSKDYVKSVIISLIAKYGSISGPQLKEVVVQEQGLCSKSSFYRLLLELEQDSQVSVIQRGKEKSYLPTSEVLN